MDDTGLSWQQRLGDWWQDDKPWLREAPRLESEKQRDWFFWRQKRGVVVAGRMSAEEGKKVALWAQTLGWPLIGDVLSQTGQPLPCADLWLGNAKATSELQQAQIVVQLGSSLTGKRLLQWQASCEPEEYWIVDDIEGRLDPAHHRGRRLIANIADWLELHPAEKRQPWCVEIPRLAEQAMQAVIARRDAFGEAQLAHRISDYLPEQGQLFVGNSLVVRLIDALSQLPAGYPVYSNRGQRYRRTAFDRRRRSAGKRQTDAGDCGRSLRTLRSQRAGVIASGFCAAGINCGEQQRRANFLAVANAAKRA